MRSPIAWEDYGPPRGASAVLARGAWLSRSLIPHNVYSAIHRALNDCLSYSFPLKHVRQVRCFAEGNDRNPRRAPRNDGRSKAQSSDSRPGDWTCSSCGASNFARRSDCFKCGAKGPGGGGGGGGGARGGRQGGRGGKRRDQWSWAIENERQNNGPVEVVRLRGVIHSEISF